MVRECRFSSGAAYVGIFLDMIVDCSERQANAVDCAFVHNLSTLVVDRVPRALTSGLLKFHVDDGLRFPECFP